MNKNQIMPLKADDFSGWYKEVINRAKLAVYSPIEGCMSVRPDGYSLWAGILNALRVFTEERKPQDTEEIFYLYRDFCRDVLAIPVSTEPMPQKDNSDTIIWQRLAKGLISNTYPARIDTARYLDELFLEMASVNSINYYSRIADARMTDWEFVTHLLETVVAVHGDNRGLVLPPKIAPTQVLIIPTEFEVRPAAFRIRHKLLDSGIRTMVDDRSKVRTTEKNYESELCGIPLKIEFSPSDARQGKVVVTFRHDNNKRPTSFRSGILYNFPSSIMTMLQIMQDELLRLAAENG